MENYQHIQDSEQSLILAWSNIRELNKIKHEEIKSLPGDEVKIQSKQYRDLKKKYDIRTDQKNGVLRNECYKGEQNLLPIINSDLFWYKKSQLFRYASMVCATETIYLEENDRKVRLAIEAFMHRFSSYTGYVNGHDYQNNPILIIHPVVQIDTDTHKKELNALADTISPILTQCASKDIRLYKQIACVQHSSLVDDSSAKVELKTVAYMEKKDSFRIVRWKPHAYPSGKTETHVGSLREALHWVYDNCVPGTTRKE